VRTKFTFTSIADLAPQFLDSCEAVRCFAQAYTSFALTDLALPALSDAELDFVVAAFGENELSLEALLRAFVQTPSFLQE
jgi:hypothetical protein